MFSSSRPASTIARGHGGWQWVMTRWTYGAHRPDPDLSKVFCRYSIKNAQRVEFALRIKSCVQVASLAADQSVFEGRIEGALGTSWPDAEPDRVADRANWVCVWRACLDLRNFEAEEEKEARSVEKHFEEKARRLEKHSEEKPRKEESGLRRRRRPPNGVQTGG